MLNKHFLTLPHGKLDLPVFLPDATYGFVHALDNSDLQSIGITALVMNVFHLMRTPGTTIIKSMNGLHNFSNWQGPIVTDSGGFQVYSLLRKNPKFGSISKKGVNFHSKRDFLLTPEKSIQLQLNYKADIIICLDYCTHPDDPYDLQVESVNRTI